MKRRCATFAATTHLDVGSRQPPARNAARASAIQRGRPLQLRRRLPGPRPRAPLPARGRRALHRCRRRRDHALAVRARVRRQRHPVAARQRLVRPPGARPMPGPLPTRVRMRAPMWAGPPVRGLVPKARRPQPAGVKRSLPRLERPMSGEQPRHVRPHPQRSTHVRDVQGAGAFRA